MITYIRVTSKETNFKFGGFLYCSIETLRGLSSKYCLPEYGCQERNFEIEVYEEAMKIEGRNNPLGRKPKGEVIYAYDLTNIFKSHEEVHGIGDMHF